MVRGEVMGREDFTSFLLLPPPRAEGPNLWHLVTSGQRGSMGLGLGKVQVFIDMCAYCQEQALSDGPHLVIIALTDPLYPPELGGVCY